ncbi:hypothetical protein FHG87_011039 [Trinorchestia longiramus]|nr:hypothetical protein FHG87_011039 [Trinorchestia longiramus]
MRSPSPAMLLLISLVASVFYSLISTGDYKKDEARLQSLIRPGARPRTMQTDKAETSSDVMDTNATNMCHATFSFAKLHFDSTVKNELSEILHKVKQSFKQNFGGATEPYEEISKLYPSLLVKNFRNFKMPLENPILSNTSERQNLKHRMLRNQPEFSYKLTEKSVLDMTAGILPSSPCTLKHNYDSAQLSSALGRAVAHNNGSLKIIFLGDSKLRDMFLALLIKTRHLDYTVYCNNTSTSLAGALQDLVQDKHLWTTRKATASQVPGLLIMHVFESFSVGTVKNFEETPIVALLHDWVDGNKQPPDVLVVGYGQWMFYMMMMLKELPLTVLNCLDYLLGVDHLVTSLVKKLPKKTLVLFLAQTRQRPHARTEYNVKFDVNSVGNTEWRDSILLQRLAILFKSSTQNEFVHRKNSILKSGENSYSQKPNHSSFHALYRPIWRQQLATYEASRLTYENFIRKLHRNFVDNLPPYLRPNQTVLDGKVAKDVHNLRLKKLRHLISFKDDIKNIPQILFWDSSLPLNLARIRDCATLYEHDPDTANAIPFILGRKMRTLKYESLLQRMKASDHSDVLRQNTNDLNPSASNVLEGVGTEITSRADYLLPSVRRKSLVGNPTNFLLHENYTFHDEEFVKESQVTSRANARRFKELSPDEIYLNDFVKAYSSPELNCMDDLHAGVSTNEIEALQLLNLLTNPHLQPHDNVYCCQ